MPARVENKRKNDEAIWIGLVVLAGMAIITIVRFHLGYIHIVEASFGIGLVAVGLLVALYFGRVRLHFRRVRFRFGLRTLFVVIMIFSQWLAWQVYVVQDRQAVLRLVKDHGGNHVSKADLVDDPFIGMVPDIWWFRRLLGDRFIVFIYLKPDSEQQLIDRVREAFPEAGLIDASEQKYLKPLRPKSPIP